MTEANSFLQYINVKVLLATAIANNLLKEKDLSSSLTYCEKFEQLDSFSAAKLQALYCQSISLPSPKHNVVTDSQKAAIRFLAKSQPNLYPFLLKSLEASIKALEVKPLEKLQSSYSTTTNPLPSQVDYLIVGAGISGITFAYKLLSRGITNFLLIDRSYSIGGTWTNNQYPGVRVDVGNILYSFSFAKHYNWTSVYPEGSEILEYLLKVVNQTGISRFTSLGTSLEAAEFLEGDQNLWRVQTSAGNMTCKYLIMATGQLSVPNNPFKEASSLIFKGRSFHSSELKSDHSQFKDQKVALIGSASSAFQIGTAIAPNCSHLKIIQRSPSWFHYVPHYRQASPSSQSFFYRRIPLYYDYFRLFHLIKSDQNILPNCRLDSSGSLVDQDLTDKFSSSIRSLAKSYQVDSFLPDYPPGAKRILVDDGSWIKLAQRHNVDFLSGNVDAITCSGVRLDNGDEVCADVLIFATGFTSTAYGFPAKITNSSGINLNTYWSGRPGAFHGICVPNYPNLFFLFGPNTNAPVQGATTLFSEVESMYIIDLIQHSIDQDCTTIEVLEEQYNDYLNKLDAENAKYSWGGSSVSSWYQTKDGASTQNWPFAASNFWQQAEDQRQSGYKSFIFR